MPLEAAFRRDDGTPNEPGVDSSWNDWVAASRTMHYCADDPLLDWLSEFGEAKGFVQDDKRPGFDPRTDFIQFIFRKGREFEAAVISYLTSQFQLTTICESHEQIRSRAHVEATWRAMCGGAEIIVQGTLWNAETMTYGAPDLLVRADVLCRLFPDQIAEEEARVQAPDLPVGVGHYRVVDVKFTRLDLKVDGCGAAKHKKHSIQIGLYHDALGRLQGFTPNCGFLLGRSWKRGDDRGPAAFERLARIDCHDPSVHELAREACAWVRRVRSEGKCWRVLPEPSVPELRPNMRNMRDQPWHHAKAEIARELQDLTLLPRVTLDLRSSALQRGLCRWTDAGCSAAALGITGAKNPVTVDAVIAANHSNADGPWVFPSRVGANEHMWREPVVSEFYVDFETVSDLDDDFAAFPRAGGQPLIFMAGCGWWTGPVEDRQWNFRAFTVDRLVPAEERRILEAWFDHMRNLCAAAGASLDQARVFHWSPAEPSTLENSYNSARTRHDSPPWPTMPWVDLLNKVVREEPVTVRGAFGFGLKAIGKALHGYGCIQTLWQDGSTDGLGAMVGAWSCHHEATHRNVSMRDIDLMREIERYNEVDCRVMAETLGWLRRER